MMSLALLVLLADPSPLGAAREHLAKGQLDDVLFDLDGKALAEADKGPAAALLGRAGEAAWTKEDTVLAFQFAQMALRLNKDEPKALEVGARAARTQKLYGPAEDYAQRWIAASQGGARARLLRGEIATDQGDWEVGLQVTSEVKEKELSGEERTRLQLVRQTCRKELAEQKASVSTVKLLEQKMEAAAERAKKQRPADVRPALASAASGQVVLYGTSWCGFCAKAREYFQHKRIDYVDRDVEKESGAAEELAQKLAAAGKRATGVPVIDVRGTLVVGFDRPQLDRLLR